MIKRRWHLFIHLQSKLICPYFQRDHFFINSIPLQINLICNLTGTQISCLNNKKKKQLKRDVVAFPQTILTKRLPSLQRADLPPADCSCTIRGTVSCEATFCFQHRNYSMQRKIKANQTFKLPIILPSLHFARSTDDAGDTGDSGRAFAWEVRPCSA